MFRFHEIVIYKQQNANNETNALISVKVTFKMIETHLTRSMFTKHPIS